MYYFSFLLIFVMVVNTIAMDIQMPEDMWKELKDRARPLCACSDHIFAATDDCTFRRNFLHMGSVILANLNAVCEIIIAIDGKVSTSVPTDRVTPSSALYRWPTTTVTPSGALYRVPTTTVTPWVALYRVPTTTVTPWGALYRVPSATVTPSGALYRVPTTTVTPWAALYRVPTTTVTPWGALYRVPTTTVKPTVATYRVPNTTVKPTVATYRVANITDKPTVATYGVPTTTVKPTGTSGGVPTTTVEPTATTAGEPTTITVKPDKPETGRTDEGTTSVELSTDPPKEAKKYPLQTLLLILFSSFGAGILVAVGGKLTYDRYRKRYYVLPSEQGMQL